MIKLLKISATAVIVAAGLSTGHSSAEIQLNSATITQATCQARFVRNKKIIKETHIPETSMVVHTDQRLMVSDWPQHAVNLLNDVNSNRFDDGTLNIVDCVGSSSTVRVRTRDFDLDHVNRQGNERRGWRFNAEAENTNQPILRVVRLELPPNHEWQINTAGDGLIAAQRIFHPQSNDDLVFYNRIRVTEVKRINHQLTITQRTTTDNQFDELETWTLN